MKKFITAWDFTVLNLFHHCLEKTAVLIRASGFTAAVEVWVVNLIIMTMQIISLISDCFGGLQHRYPADLLWLSLGIEIHQTRLRVFQQFWRRLTIWFLNIVSLLPCSFSVLLELQLYLCLIFWLCALKF